ncbi:MFS transporter [Bifidobacterium aquikefiricola]|uniref:MFS transporter n=1 Tax=Bifidobacterium aquikefiricola TaxID=3059038 RepID=A0AB39U4V3_9BIFI
MNDTLRASPSRVSPPPPHNFILLLIGQTVTVFGSSLLRFALSLYILDLTGRADLFATLFALSSIPVLLSPIGGAISDRASRKMLMVAYDFTCAVITIAFLLALLSHQASVLVIGIVMIGLGFVGAMETPNGTACIPLLVSEERLASANGSIQVIQSLSGIVAPVIGGIAYGTLGVNALVLASGVAFALAAIMETFIAIPHEQRARTHSMVRTIAGGICEGFRHVSQDTTIVKLLIVAAFLNFVLAPCLIVAAPLVLRMTLHTSDTVYGMSMGLMETAMIIGALTAGFFTKSMRNDTAWRYVLSIAILFLPMTLATTPILVSITVTITAWVPLTMFLISIMLVAALTSILNIFAIVQIQTRTPEKHLGKVMAIVLMVAQCVAPIGQMLYGAAFKHLSAGAYLPLLIAGGALLLVTCLTKSLFPQHITVHKQGDQ